MAAGPLQDALQAVLTDAHNDALETNANVGDAMRAALGRVAAMVEAAAEKADLAHESSESYDRLLRQYGPDIVDFGVEAYIARCEQGEDWDVAVRLRVTAASHSTTHLRLTRAPLARRTSYTRQLRRPTRGASGGLPREAPRIALSLRRPARSR